MFIFQFKQAQASQREENDEIKVEKNTNSEKSATSEEFLKTPETRDFIREWSGKMRDGKQLYTKRGLTALLRALHPSFDSDKKVRTNAKEILSLLGGMDGLTGFLAGWKAKSEGLLKSIKGLFGGS